MVIRLERARLNKCDALLRPSFLNQCSGLQNNPPTLSDPNRSDGCFPTLRDSTAIHRLQSAVFLITHKSVIIGSDSCLHQIQHGQIFLLMDCQTGGLESCWLGLDIDKGVALIWWCRFKDNVVTKFGEFFVLWADLVWKPVVFGKLIEPIIMQTCSFSNNLLSNNSPSSGKIFVNVSLQL